jgi:peptidoglycan/LPS O-acetylase OafA/YrhL
MGERAVRADSAPRETRYIPTLDGWRAVAIVTVMLQHASDQISATAGSWIDPVMDVFHENGRFGVYIFFAISGYLITTLLLQELERTSGASLAAFYVRRAFRILPPLIVVLAVMGVLGATGVIPMPFGRWLSALLFYYNYSSAGSTWYLGHFWSLAVEEHFYLLWPAILVLLRPRRAMRVAVGLIVAVAVWRLVDLSMHLTASATIRFDDRTDTQLDGLLWGCLLAILCQRVVNRERLAALTAGWRWWGLLAVLVVSQAVNLEAPALFSVQLALRPFLIGLVVIGTVVNPARRAGRVLEWSALRWLGRISYSLYLWQQLFLVWDGFEVDGLRWVQRFPVSVLAALVVATLSHRFIERPTIAIGRRLASRVRVRRVGVVVPAGAVASGPSPEIAPWSGGRIRSERP